MAGALTELEFDLGFDVGCYWGFKPANRFGSRIKCRLKCIRDMPNGGKQKC